MNFLLDTNAIIYLINGRLALALPDGRYGVSVITEIELLSFPDLRLDEEQRIRAFLAVCDRVAIDEPIRDQAIALRRRHRLKISDAIIAATAMVADAVLFSNDGKLAGIPDLRLRAVPIEPG